jgi:hypothetical protein
VDVISVHSGWSNTSFFLVKSLSNLNCISVTETKQYTKH